MATEIEMDSETESWQRARYAMSRLEPFHLQFTTSVRLLELNQDENSRTGRPERHLNHGSRFLMGRFLKSPLVTGPLATLRATLTGSSRAVQEHELLSDFSPHDLAAILALLFLRRKAKKIAPEKEVRLLAQTLSRSVNIGVTIGRMVPQIGVARGILVGALRPIAYCALASCDEKTYADYRKAMRLKKRMHDLKVERETWGCTHAQIVSLILQGFGFGIGHAAAAERGLSGSSQVESLTEPDRFRVIATWIDTLLLGKEVPMEHAAEYEVTEEDYRRYSPLLKRYAEEDEPSCFLDYVGPESESVAPSGQSEVASYESLSPAIRESLTEEDLTNLQNAMEELGE